MVNQKICIIGAGSMAEAIVSGILEKELYQPDHISMINSSNHQRLAELTSIYNVVTDIKHPSRLISEANILVLAMKPKDAEAALQKIKADTHASQLVISVLAGISTTFISTILGHQAPVIRTMPNTSASIGLSATGISVGAFAQEEHLSLTKHIFEAIGSVAVVEESKLDAVTGVSGSGPAYVYYMVESMMEGAVDVGLTEQQAKDLVIQTVLGASQMLKKTEEDPVSLRNKVTSPNGTTEAGIEVLKNNQFKEIVKKSIARASERSKELAEAFSKIDK